MAVYHTPVMLDESLHALNIKTNGIYADLTFGGGGHSSSILKSLKEGRLISFDQDLEALANIPDDKRITPVHGNFRYLSNYFRYLGVEEVDGIIADLGVSMHQFDAPERGFTYRNDAVLDMRMNNSSDITAANVLNSYSVEQLSGIFIKYADIHFARRLAVSILKYRESMPFKTTGQLSECVSPFCRPNEKNKILSRVFQAIRIEVNNEFDALAEMLPQATEYLKKGGRLVILTYHSAEDRIVKNFIKTGNVEGKEEKDIRGQKADLMLKSLNTKPLIASSGELGKNPAARSAKLRVAEKI